MKPITEEQRQSLIYDCEKEIKLIERDLASYRGNPALMSELIRQQIALASLKASAVHQAEGSSGWRDVTEKAAHILEIEGIPVRVLYTAPPAWGIIPAPKHNEE